MRKSLGFGLAGAFLLSACNGGGDGGGLGLGGGAQSAALETPCSQLMHSDPRLKDMSDDGIGLTSKLGLASGRYALPPTGNPTQLVVNFHGHNNNSCAW